jgi:hypothetical protein
VKKRNLLALAGMLSASVALPGLAQPYRNNNNYPVWDRIGSVDFNARPEHEVQYGTFGGRVNRLSFRATTSDVMCRNVSATFENGRSRSIYTGTLPRGSDVVVDLPGADRSIRRIDFDCRSLAPRGTRVDIAADIGNYRAEWRQSPDWDRTWARMFAWAADFRDDARNGGRGPGRDEPGWITLSSERFEGPADSETSLIGARGRSIDTVALRPLDNDARCARVSATFANGRSSDLYVNRGAPMVRGRMYEIDLPGRDRNLRELNMTCRGERGRPVTIQVYGNR